MEFRFAERVRTAWGSGRVNNRQHGLKTKKAVLKENERGDCQVALLLGQKETEMQPVSQVPWVLAADTGERIKDEG